MFTETAASGIFNLFFYLQIIRFSWKLKKQKRGRGMAELFFILTVIFVAYVLVVVIGDKKNISEAVKTAGTTKVANNQPQSAGNIAETAPQAEVPTAEDPVNVSAENSLQAGVTSPAVEGLKNPKTGEFAKIPGNYTFAKRWIKEALVSEGLLEKIYKNNEIDEATSAKIHDALQKLKAMEKYHP